MTSLAQYSAALNDAPQITTATPGRGSRIFGAALYASTFALVALAALQAA